MVLLIELYILNVDPDLFFTWHLTINLNELINNLRLNY